MKETLTSISQRLGISTTIISRVLNGKAEQYRISKETVARVLEEVRRCNYVSSNLDISLKANKTSSIGLIVPQISNPYFADLAGAIISEAKSRGYTTTVMDTMESNDNLKACVSTLLSRKVEGIIVSPCGDDGRIFDEVNKNVCPVVFVDRYFPDCRIPFVTSNNYKGAYDITNLLIMNGHKDIACIQGSPSSMPNARRISGYSSAMEKNGLEDRKIIVGDSFSIRNGYLETKLLLGRESRPSAIFALNYTILLGVIKALHDTTLRIPEDISIVSFDDNISMEFMTPPMTCIRQPVEEMGRLATKLLLENIKNNSNMTSQLELSTNVVVRGSIGKCPRPSRD